MPDAAPAHLPPGSAVADSPLPLGADGGFFVAGPWREVWRELTPGLVALRFRRVAEWLGVDRRRSIFGLDVKRLHLHETGDPARDAPMIEHNRPVAAALPELIDAALAQGDELWLPGLDGRIADVARAAGPKFLVRATRRHLAPWRSLAPLRRAGGDLATQLTRNGREQLRRARRGLEAAGGGPLRLETAVDTVTALAWFDRLEALHRASFAARGLGQGAFDSPGFGRFHRRLIVAAARAGTVRLMRLAAGHTELGYLYNFRWGGVEHAYQSGFAPQGDGRLKPGLVAHAAALEAAAASGLAAYDFLAGAARYKLTLADHAWPMVWGVVARRRPDLVAEAGLRRLKAASLDRPRAGGVRPDQPPALTLDAP